MNPSRSGEMREEDSFEEMATRMADLLGDVDQARLHPGSVMAEAEARLLDDHNRAPMFSTGGGAALVSYALDTQGLRWWLRGTPAGMALARLSDDEVVQLADRGSGARDAALDHLDQYADELGEAARQMIDRDKS